MATRITSGLILVVVVSFLAVSQLIIDGVNSRCDYSVLLGSPNDGKRVPKRYSAFETAVRSTYDRLFNNKDASKANERRKFVLEEWPHRGVGNLIDKDRVLIGNIYSEVDSVFEFGIGESTYIADYVGVPRYVGVGSDEDPARVPNVKAIVKDRFRFYYVPNIGEPDDSEMNYISHKNEFDYLLRPLYSELEAFDVYAVSGKWHFSCLLMCFLHASARGAIASDPIVLIHNISLDMSHSLDHLLDLVYDMKGEVSGYRRKASTTDAQLLATWNGFYGID